MPEQSNEIAEPDVVFADANQGDENENDDEEDASMLKSSYGRSIHFRQTRKRGKIIKQVTEQYVRNDMGFGITYTAEGDIDSDDDDDSNSESEESTKNNKLHSQVDQVVGRPRVIPTVQDLLSRLIPDCRPNALVVVDTNVLLHNLDVLEKAVLGEDTSSSKGKSAGVMPNIVIPQTALMECRSNRLTAYDRTVDLLRSVTRELPTDLNKQQNDEKEESIQRHCPIFFPDQNHAATATPQSQNKILPKSNAISTPNDENDRRIRRVAHYLAKHVKGTNVRVVLLTDDKACRQLAQQESGSLYQAYSVATWVRKLEQANPQMSSSLSDLVANFSASMDQDSVVDSSNKNLPKAQYTPHVKASTLSLGIQQGTYHRGCFRVVSQSGAGDERTGSVTIRQGEERVAVTISTQQDANRAIDGDIVGITINPVDEWISSGVGKSRGSTGHKDESGAKIASETADATPADLENVSENIAVDNDMSMMRPTGKVVGIMRRNFDSYSGSIYETAASEKKSNKGDKSNIATSELVEREEIASRYEREHEDGTSTCVFFPVDRKVPPILIRTTQRDRLLGQRIVVGMDSWPAQSTFPLGHYVRTIGPAGSKDVETQVLLQEHNIPHEPFPAAVLACLPPDDYKIGADMKNTTARLDLRHLPVLSIDPPGCKDIDDALHCMKLPNGNYQIGVHIADVTHYVKAGTAIDMEAANRSTSTYLVNKRLDMLPGLLTTDLCSLKGNVDRYAFSVLWEVTEDADIIDVEFHKTLIHSVGALTYQQAQSLIDQPDDPNDVHACAVKGLASLARKFRQRRINAGALTLASPEVKFVLDSESLNPTDVQAYALLEANALVEEFMLLANVTVSKKILRHYPTLSVLRRHPAPNRAMFDSLISKAKSKGLSIEIDDSKRLADSLDAAQVAEDPYVNKLLRILSTRCMSPAQYFCSGEFPPTEWHHYGLAAPVYTHFTSPIRRYADVCVHRLLAAAINVAPLPPQLSSKSYLHDLCANMNRRHRSAQMAGRASVQLHTLIFFAGDGAKEEDAYVLDVETAEASVPSLSVMVPRYGIEGRVRLTLDPTDPKLTRLPDAHKLVYEPSSGPKVSLQVFDKVRVRIWVRETQDHRRELIVDLIEPRFESPVDGDEGEHNNRPKKKTKVS
eukprot:CAMPEP_0172461050 /NCGR_PEP_ID=MMETSP1065-20121228/39244_1 /TAXON_ID=265537 /ORGANISM="Amphiprora paludosa, Strain CCMP125" /LENGTH=1142 /DNA_ID=CAMNT_0013216249 /DNA_START=23 /DNA_END=3451 /DNA_ORIENTATION=-